MAEKMRVEDAMRAQAKLDGVNTIPSFFDENGHVRRPCDLNQEQRNALHDWLFSDKVDNVIGPALNDAKLAMLGAIKDR
jgi:hypothetical protein